MLMKRNLPHRFVAGYICMYVASSPVWIICCVWFPAGLKGKSNGPILSSIRLMSSILFYFLVARVFLIFQVPSRILPI